MHLDRDTFLLLPTSDDTCRTRTLLEPFAMKLLPYPPCPRVREFLGLRIHRCPHIVNLYYNMFVGPLFSRIGSVME